jgi:hypothetical protein
MACLPIMPEVYAVGEQKGIVLVALPTPELWAKVEKRKRMDVNASLHVTC